MRRWFLSYNSQDLALMQGLEAALRRKDAEAHIFFALKSLRAGGFWLPELVKEIAEATAFVLLVGENGVSPWQIAEYYEAIDRRVKEQNFPVVLVLLDGQPAPGLPFLRQLHWIVAPDPASEQSVAKLMAAAAGEGSRLGGLWRHTAPYRGLAAMTEADSDFFFGRGRETVQVIEALASGPDKLPVLLGNSGVGKSSLAQAGVLAALTRQAWPETASDAGPWPRVFQNSRQWCFLTVRPGVEPIKALVEAFLEKWQFHAGDPARIRQRNEWIELLLDENRKTNLPDLLDETERRQKELNQSKPPAFFLYIDQGEELYVRAEPRQRGRFSEILARGLRDPRLRALMSIRSDFLGALQGDEPLFDARRQIDVPPLREAQLREVVSSPAALLSARFETEVLAADIARRTAEESAKDAGALPLLSYLLDDMWSQMVKRGDATLRLPAAAIELGGVLAERGNAFLAHHPGSEDALRGLLTLKLAAVRENGEPTRRPAPRSEFTDEEWRLVSELADHPNRLLVTATPEGGETFAEVAHEAIFRRWEKLREWIAAEREFLAWRSGLEAARRAWQATPHGSKNDALLMGLPLAQAQSWLAKRAEDMPRPDREFVALSIERERKARGRARRVRALVYVLLVGIIAGLVGWIKQGYVKEQWTWYATMQPYMLGQVRPFVLTAEQERALVSGASFHECAKDCPEMIVVPDGEFMMGSPKKENGRLDSEGPQHGVVFAKPFAVSKFEVTFEQWDACVRVGGCPQVSDTGMGRGTKPVINVTWDDAQKYVAWFSQMTGKPYRLLSEAEWEYAARAGSSSRFSYDEASDDEAQLDQLAWYRANSKDRTHPVGEKKPNAFGLYDMHGNVREWVEDPWHDSYQDAPTDGLPWVKDGDASGRVVRGGSWYFDPQGLRAARRDRYASDGRVDDIGFRLARTLNP
jgi:formylglycine-generating enzyme required for sulfatase activity